MSQTILLPAGYNEFPLTRQVSLTVTILRTLDCMHEVVTMEAKIVGI